MSQPTIHSRTEWGATKAREDAFAQGDARGIILHNMENANRTPGATAEAETAAAYKVSRDCQDFHMRPKSKKGNGWSDIGQHWTISRGGVIMEGRLGTLSAAEAGKVVRGAHANSATYNQHWFGIEMEGNYVKSDVLTDSAWEALVALCTWLSEKAGSQECLPILPHRDVRDTDCPGKLADRLPTLTKAVNDRLSKSSPSASLAKGAKKKSPSLAAAKASSAKKAAAKKATASATCSTGWYTTGYYSPAESDFSGPRFEVNIRDHGREAFPGAFLDAVKMEGWGKTRFGWYLGRYSNAWHKSPSPLDAKGKALVVGAIAVDPDLIPFGSKVTIPSLPSPWNTKSFLAKDVGSAIQGKHIDIYCGEGISAEQATFQVTGHNRQVCVE
ncbi:MAG: N-acetylmuramoyl-L-alanine amidase [Verrucomicrobiales bacterium]|nr:N-acetylmuramoyl-L-alanine amidase [Verrucomicrobiales bacterium]